MFEGVHVRLRMHSEWKHACNLRKPKLGAWRTLWVPDWRLERLGNFELNIKDDVGGC